MTTTIKFENITVRWEGEGEYLLALHSIFETEPTWLKLTEEEIPLAVAAGERIEHLSFDKLTLI